MISFSISSTAIAQNKRKITVEKPDLEEIRISTLTPSSPYYFPKLMKKYESNDTTMTNDEYRHFYLGYMFQEDFDPYRVSPYANVTDDLRMKSSHTKEANMPSSHSPTIRLTSARCHFLCMCSRRRGKT